MYATTNQALIEQELETAHRIVAKYESKDNLSMAHADALSAARATIAAYTPTNLEGKTMNRWIARFVQTTYNGYIVRSMEALLEAETTNDAYDRAYERIADMLQTEAGWMLDGICPVD